MWPSVNKVMTWLHDNESPQGLLDSKWWVFIDWTHIDRSKRYTTALQIWYYQALRSAASIAKEAGQSETEYSQRADILLTNLLKYGLDKKTGTFADSFSYDEQSKSKGLVTNSLAGMINIFPQGTSDKAVRQFEDNLYTADPFSESWVIEWLLNAGKKDLALKTMRGYWGGMVRDGATAIYETYTPGIHKDPTSYSHAWGCGPIYLYERLSRP